MEYFKQLKEKIEYSEAIVVGIGNEFNTDIKSVIRENLIYKSLKDKLSKAVNEELITENELRLIEGAVYYKELSSGSNPIINASIKTYNKLYDMIGDKNYFVVTTNYDDVIYKSSFCGESNENRIVSPCGSVLRLQYQCDCNVNKENNNGICSCEAFYEELYLTMSKMTDNDDISVLKELIPYCVECQKVLTLNTYGNLGYNETGYIDKWNEYTNWLQKSLNKNLVLIELGVDFSVPTVIRWPFEKMALLNYKATIFRVNEKLPQLAVEIKDKGYSLDMNAKKFIDTYQ